MNLRTSNHRYPVDAGNIGVLAYEHAECRREDYGLFKMFDLKKAGRYKVTLKISNCWLGNKQKTAVLDTTTGKFLVGDLCYMFDKGWEDFLDETKFLSDNDGKYWLACNTGGDGRFLARVDFKEVI